MTTLEVFQSLPVGSTFTMTPFYSCRFKKVSETDYTTLGMTPTGRWRTIPMSRETFVDHSANTITPEAQS